MNKTKALCLSSLLFSYYLISQFLPINLPFFSTSGLILGLMFPFINKKLRYIITLLYQANFWYKIGAIYHTGFPTIDSIMKYALSIAEPSPVILQYSQETINTVSTIIQNVYVFLMINPQIFATLKILSQISLITLYALAMGCLLFEAILFISISSQPYSCYILYEYLGFFRLVEKHTGGRINI